MLLLHGWGLSGRTYQPAMLALADRGFRVVAPSLAVADGWTIERAAESAAEALAGVDAAPAPVVGHSFGGAIGAHLALQHPDFVTALIAVSSPLVSLGSVRMGRILLPGGHYRILGHSPAAGALVRAVAQGGGVQSLLRSARWFLGAEQDRTLRELAKTGLPRMILWAARDQLLPAGIGVRASELLECEFRLIGASNGWRDKSPPDHDWPFREPAHFADTVCVVLKEITAPKKRKTKSAR